MPFITQGKANIKYLLIVVLVSAVAGGIIFASWNYYQKEIVNLNNFTEIKKIEKKSISGIKLISTKLATTTSAYEIAYDINSLVDLGNLIVFSPDRKNVAYVAIKNGEEKMTLFLNNEEIGVFDMVGYLSFDSSNNLSYAYGDIGTRNIFIISNNEKIATCTNAVNVFVSPDNKHYACVIDKNGKEIVIYDKKESSSYQSITSENFSPDSQHFAYLAEKGKNNYVVVVDGKESKSYESIYRITFSPDSQHIAYSVKTNGNSFMVLDGKEKEIYEFVGFPSFSPDSEHFGYSAETVTIQEKTKNPIYNYFIITDDKISSEIYANGGAGTPIFSPDGNHTAFVAQMHEKITPYKLKSFIVIDNKEGSRHDGIIGDPIFSPDSQHIAYVARDDKKGTFLVLDQKENEISDNIIGSIFFSPNNKNVAYKVMTSHGKYFISIDGKSGKIYDQIYGEPIFSLDGQIVNYGARVGNELWWIAEEAK